MSNKVPEVVRNTIRKRVWDAARAINWEALSLEDRTRQYEHWTAAPDVGGVLMRYMDKAKVRGYIKEAVMKPFARALKADAARPLRAFRIGEDAEVVDDFERPHGLALADGRVICWGSAKDWKHVLMALHERTFRASGRRPFGAVLSAAAGQFQQAATRALVEDAAKRLGVEHVVWLDI